MRYLFAIITVASLNSACIASETVKVKVTDDAGNVLEGATVDVWFLGFTGDDDIKISGQSNGNGDYSAQGSAKTSIDVVASKKGWYPSDRKGFRKDEGHEVEIKVREKRNPIPLVVRAVDTKFPVHDQEIGFDLVVGDWVAPHGKGVTADFFAKFSREFKGIRYSGQRLEKSIANSKRGAAARNEVWTEELYRDRAGNWDAQVEIRFPTGGIVEERKNYLPYNKMKMPHSAPKKDYEDRLMLERSNYGQSEEPVYGGYFLQTRVEKQGEFVKQANYAKIASAIKITTRGDLDFIYYFNPAVNDRNLEFDPLKNLAKDQKRRFEP